MLWGDGGYNLLIGGDGRDMLFGSLPGDILIGGRTVFSDPPPAGTVNRQALRAIERFLPAAERSAGEPVVERAA